MNNFASNCFMMPTNEVLKALYYLKKILVNEVDLFHLNNH